MGQRHTRVTLRAVPSPARQPPANLGRAKVGHALPQPCPAPEAEVWFEYRVMNKPALISPSVGTVKEEADCGQMALATRVS